MLFIQIIHIIEAIFEENSLLFVAPCRRQNTNNKFFPPTPSNRDFRVLPSFPSRPPDSYYSSISLIARLDNCARAPFRRPRSTTISFLCFFFVWDYIYNKISLIQLTMCSCSYKTLLFAQVGFRLIVSESLYKRL